MPKLIRKLKPEDAPPGWEATLLSFRLVRDYPTLSRDVRADGFRRGPFDVFFDGRNGWVIVHRPTSLYFARYLPTLGDAIRVAEAGISHGGGGLLYDSPTRVAALCPRWFNAWLYAVRDAKAFVDPAPFAGKKR